MSFTPLHDRVLVRRVDSEEKTSGGLIIPDSAQEKPQEGEIIAVGLGKLTDDGNRLPMDVVVGDKVIYSKYAGTEFKDKDGDDDLVIMRESDILAKKS